MTKKTSQTRDLREERASGKTRRISVQIGNRVIHESIEDNIELSSLAPQDLMRALNTALGKFAYYGSLRADANRMLSKVKTEFEIWMVQNIHTVERLPDYKKKTEKAKVNKAILENLEDYGNRKEIINRGEEIVAKLEVLQRTFQTMVTSMQSILAFRRAELESQMRSEGAEGDD